MKPCRVCKAPMVSSYQWRTKLTAEQRKEHRARGVAGHHSCGLCSNCYERSRYHGTERERLHIPTATVVADWKHLADKELSTMENVRYLAPRMGMTVGALKSAVARAKQLGLLEVAA